MSFHARCACARAGNSVSVETMRVRRIYPSHLVVVGDLPAPVDPEAGSDRGKNDCGHDPHHGAKPPPDTAHHGGADELEELSHCDAPRDAASSAFSRKENTLPHCVHAKLPVCAPRSYSFASWGCSQGASAHASRSSCARFCFIWISSGGHENRLLPSKVRHARFRMPAAAL